ncbi:hypothetical protein DID88_005506 [Monilinia fructigena]|uniref:Major facilitator superfamily (MFS) profile domain-containing protein n=1 Tax=Monilinia fructigena TaxID=38457 RepID=A0A395J2D0_9HELO|nr:hypothetical protein DID88_005506 [Monilinia fructigena]
MASASKLDLDHIEEGVKDSSAASVSGIKPNSGLPQPPEWIAALSPEERTAMENKLKRKIDLRLFPMVILMYIMNYLDRNNIAAARLAGMEEDLNLVGDQYQTCVSILFVGYLLMQIPSNLFLNKLGKPAVYLPSAMILWGCISAATAGTHNYIGLLMCRFFLGFVEAAYFPLWRLEEDVGMDDWVDSHQQSFMHGLKLAFMDIKVYILMLLIFGIVAAGSVTNFFPIYTAFVVALAWISNTLPRPPAKRATALALINAVSNTSSIYASYMYPSSAGPRYVLAMSVNSGMVFLAICAALILRIMLVRLNKKLDRGEAVDGAVNEGTVAAGQKGFRYKV